VTTNHITSRNTRPLKVLILIDDFDAPEGGSEQHLLFLLSELPRRNIDVSFVVLSGIHRASPESFPIHPLVLSDGIGRGPFRSVKIIHRLVKYLKLIKPTLIHAFSPTGELAALIAARIARHGVVLAVRRNTGYWHTPRTLWRARLTRFLGAKYVANCDAVKQFSVETEWIPATRIAVIRNPVDIKRVEDGLENVQPRQSLGIVDGEQVVGIVATVRPVKDHITFLQAACRVLDHFPRTRFLVIGDQQVDTVEQARSYARQLGIEDQISWIGAVHNPYSLLHHFDVAVLSSRSEGLSNALLEYAMAGIPTVATEVGGARDIVVENQTGFLVPPATPELMADRICQLLHNGELRERFGKCANIRAKSLFAEESVLDEYVNLYRRLAGQTNQRNA
jgi:L-malate glycosyltransferase